MKKICMYLLALLVICTSCTAFAENSNPFAGRWCEESELGATFIFYSDGSCEGTAMFCDVKGSYTVSGNTMQLQVSVELMAGLEQYMGSTFSTTISSLLNGAVFTMQDADTMTGAEMTLKRKGSFREAKAAADGTLEGLWERKDAAGDISVMAFYFRNDGIVYAMDDGKIVENPYQRSEDTILMGPSYNTIRAELQEDGSLSIQHAGTYVKTRSDEASDFAAVSGFYANEGSSGSLTGYYLTSTGKLVSLSVKEGCYISWSVSKEDLIMAGNRIGWQDKNENVFYACIEDGVMTEESWYRNAKRKWTNDGTRVRHFRYTAEQLTAMFGLQDASDNIPAEAVGTWLSDMGTYLVIYPDGSGIDSGTRIQVKAKGTELFLCNDSGTSGLINVLTFQDGELAFKGRAARYTRIANVTAASADEDEGVKLFVPRFMQNEVWIQGLKSEESQNLTDLTIPSQLFGAPVTAIGTSAFASCTTLQSISLPETVTQIGNYAFTGCSSLREVHIPATVQTIGEHAFENSGIQTLTLEKGLLHIGKYAFAGCGIQSLVLPAGLETLESYAFYRCNSLQTVEIGEGLKELKGNVFTGRSDLNIKMPMSLETISTMFADCSRLELIVYEGSTAEAFARKNWSVVNAYVVVPEGAGAAAEEGDFTYHVQSDGTAVITAWSGDDTELVIPGKLGGYPVTVIGEHVFRWQKQIVSVTIPEGVRLIKEDAFYGCWALQTIVFPSTLVTLEKNAFGYCKILTTLHLPEGLQHIGEYAFGSCPLTQVTLPTTLKVIGQDAFHGAANRKDYSSVPLTFTANLEEIGTSAFRDSTFAGSVTLTSARTRLGVYAFAGCTSLSSITLPAEMTQMPDGFLSDTLALHSIELPETLTAIPSDAFGGSGLYAIKIPASVVSIGTGAFENCSKLQRVKFIGAPRSIGDRAFSACKAMNSLALPEGLVSIGSKSFAYCDKLRTLTIPRSVTSIADDALASSDMVVLEVYAGSYAQQWAERNAIPYVVLDEDYDLDDLFSCVRDRERPVVWAMVA